LAEPLTTLSALPLFDTTVKIPVDGSDIFTTLERQSQIGHTMYDLFQESFDLMNQEQMELFKRLKVYDLRFIKHPRMLKNLDLVLRLAWWNTSRGLHSVIQTWTNEIFDRIRTNPLTDLGGLTPIDMEVFLFTALWDMESAHTRPEPIEESGRASDIHKKVR
jgi:hypothetical protein